MLDLLAGFLAGFFSWFSSYYPSQIFYIRGMFVFMAALVIILRKFFDPRNVCLYGCFISEMLKLMVLLLVVSFKDVGWC